VNPLPRILKGKPPVRKRGKTKAILHNLFKCLKYINFMVEEKTSGEGGEAELKKKAEELEEAEE